MPDLAHAYEIPQGSDQPIAFNPYDPGGGYLTLPEAEKAAQSSGGMITKRQAAPEGIAGSGLTTSDVLGMAGYVAAPWLAGAGSAVDAGVGGAAAASMPAAVPETSAALSEMGLVETAPGVFEAAAPAGAGAIGAAAGAPASGAAGPVMLNASSPVTTLDPATATALGISTSDSVFGGPAFQSAGGTMAGGAPTFGEGAGLAPGDYNVGTSGTAAGADYGLDAAAAGQGALDATTAWLKKLGLTPATAALLGVSGAQALSKPKLPQAAQDLQKTGTAGAAAASGVIHSGGTSGPAWATQKASIDATIDQQLKEQTAAMLQQAVNSGVGADSQVTLQQINKLKNQLETSRQQMYQQAQAQNVQAALTELGISDQALAQVANTQFQQSAQARAGAAQTAGLAIMLNQLGKG